MTNRGASGRRIVVLGGGITGLAAAYTLARAREAGAALEEFLIEASDRLGGVVRTERVEGFVLEAGPDSFLSEKPEAASLCRELGLGDSLLGSNDRERRSYILHRGRLVPLPDGLVLLVPARIWPILTTPLLPVRSKLAIAAERFVFSPNENKQEHADESVATFVTRHFGRAMLENIADPLLAGIFGGDSAALSGRSVLPQFHKMEQQYGSLIRGLLERRKELRVAADSKPTPEVPRPLFMTLKDGLEQMVDALRNRLDRSCLFLGQPVLAIEPSRCGGGGSTGMVGPAYRIRCEGGAVHEAHAVILALPAHECSRLLSPFDSALAESLKAIPYTSALTVALGYDAAACRHLPSGFGFLVPHKEKQRMLACTFVHNKFPHRAPPGKALLRCFLGGARDPDVLGLGNAEVVSIVRRELETILNLSQEPLFCRIYRWPSSMPQYVVGHGERLKTIESRLQCHPGLFIAGNAYSGIGVSDCIRTGRAAADRALEGCPQ